MKGSDRLFGAWFRFLPSLQTFGKDLLWPEHAVCRACARFSHGQTLCPACAEALRSEGFFCAWEKEDLEPDLQAFWLRPHTGVARTLILRLKHAAEACVAEELAALLDPLPADFSLPPSTVVTWVTMPESRRRERCIDHGQLLARAVARRLNLPCRRLLLRTDTHEKQQARLNRFARQQNLRSAFSPAEEIHAPVLLVDDVLTTGTTARRCAEALRKGGAQSVTVLTITRAVNGLRN